MSADHFKVTALTGIVSSRPHIKLPHQVRLAHFFPSATRQRVALEVVAVFKTVMNLIVSDIFIRFFLSGEGCPLAGLRYGGVVPGGPGPGAPGWGLGGTDWFYCLNPTSSLHFKSFSTFFLFI